MADYQKTEDRANPDALELDQPKGSMHPLRRQSIVSRHLEADTPACNNGHSYCAMPMVGEFYVCPKCGGRIGV